MPEAKLKSCGLTVLAEEISNGGLVYELCHMVISNQSCADLQRKGASGASRKRTAGKAMLKPSLVLMEVKCLMGSLMINVID